MAVKIRRVAIDAPSNYCQSGLPRRLSEQALDRSGISCFATPTKKRFDEKIRAALAHLQAGGKEAEMPNANQIWMLVGFALFGSLRRQGYDCIETYPHAIVYELKCSAKHKSTAEGFSGQLEVRQRLLASPQPDAFQKALEAMGYGKRHDKLDAFLSAWVASLPSSSRKGFRQQAERCDSRPEHGCNRERKHQEERQVTMSIARHHAEWLSLVPVSGPFLSLPVLMEAFNAGLEPHDPDQSRLLRQEYGNWQESFEKRKADPAPHQHWIKFVLTKTLELDDRVLAEGQAIPQTLKWRSPSITSCCGPASC